MSNGFRINECDKCVYIKHTANGYVIVCLYVDDMLIIGSNNDIIKAGESSLLPLLAKYLAICPCLQII